MINKATIRRGEIYYADLNPVVGSEEGGIRPVIILQNDKGNAHSPTVIVSSITCRLDKTHIPTHVFISSEECHLAKNSVILLEQIRTIDRMRLKKYVGSISSMKKVDVALAISIGLSAKSF